MFQTYTIRDLVFYHHAAVALFKVTVGVHVPPIKCPSWNDQCHLLVILMKQEISRGLSVTAGFAENNKLPQFLIGLCPGIWKNCDVTATSQTSDS